MGFFKPTYYGSSKIVKKPALFDRLKNKHLNKVSQDSVKLKPVKKRQNPFKKSVLRDLW